MVPGKPDEVSGVGRGGRARLGRLAKDGTEIGADRAEPLGRGEPEVDLEA